MIFVTSWCRFISKCDMIMLLTCAFDCFFGVGALNFTYLSFYVFNYPFSPLFQIIGWIIITNQLGFDYFLDKVQENKGSKMIFMLMGESPYYFSENDVDEVIIITFSLIILVCNFWMASILFTRRQL